MWVRWNDERLLFLPAQLFSHVQYHAPRFPPHLAPLRDLLNSPRWQQSTNHLTLNPHWPPSARARCCRVPMQLLWTTKSRNCCRCWQRTSNPLASSLCRVGVLETRFQAMPCFRLQAESAGEVHSQKRASPR